jgi:hypothetical protein
MTRVGRILHTLCTLIAVLAICQTAWPTKGVWAASAYLCLQDTYIDAAYPDDNFGGSDRLLIANNAQPARMLLFFDIPAHAEAANIASASLVMFGAPWTGGSGGTVGFEVYPLTRNWVEGTCIRANDVIDDDGATWNQYAYDPDPASNRWDLPGGDYDTSVSASGAFPEGNSWGPFRLDITDLVQNRFESVKNYGFIIRHPIEDSSGGWQNAASRQTSGYDPPRRPYLEIEYVVAPPNMPPDGPAGPVPPDGAVDIPVTTPLQWDAGDPDEGDWVTCDVYFGPRGNMTLISSGQEALACEPGLLQFATQYEWQIVVRDNHGAEARGPLWSFTTLASGIASVTPDSASPQYRDDGTYAPRVVLLMIRGEQTRFRFPRSQVSFDDDALQIVFSLPLSADFLLAGLVVGEEARPGLHTLTVTTGDETAARPDIFEVLKYWRGDETITVRSGDDAVPVELRDLPVYWFNRRESVRLADIVEKSALTATPELYFYNLIARDKYSLENGILDGGWGTGLPPWSDMQKGYLYATSSSGLLTTWDAGTIGAQIGQCYNVKKMGGGIIELRSQDIAQ